MGVAGAGAVGFVWAADEGAVWDGDWGAWAAGVTAAWASVPAVDANEGVSSRETLVAACRFLVQVH